MSPIKSALLVSGLAGGVVATAAWTAFRLLRICSAHCACIIARSSIHIAMSLVLSGAQTFAVECPQCNAPVRTPENLYSAV